MVKNGASVLHPRTQTRIIVDIPVEELDVDRCNVRGNVWDYDEELVRSVKLHGINLPCLVRPIQTNEKPKYGIVCGSRRFNAGIEAGLEKIPCIIQEMTDIEAMGQSLEENVIRKDVPLWQNIEWIGAMYELLRKDSLQWGSDRKFTKMDARYDELVRRTGLDRNKIKSYVKIAIYLPEEVRALMRPREERTDFQEERLRGLLYRTQSPTRTLSLYKTSLIFDELRKLSVMKQVQVAAYILSKTRGVSEKIVNLVKKHPNKDLQEIEQSLRKEPDVFNKNISLDKETKEALDEACITRHIDITDLISEIIQKWLKDYKAISQVSQYP